MKHGNKNKFVSFVIFFLIALFVFSAVAVHQVPMVNAQSANPIGIDGEAQTQFPIVQSSNLTGYSKMALANYRAYFMPNSLSSKAVAFLNDGYNISQDISTSQMTYCANATYSYAIISMASAMNPQATTLNSSGTTLEYVGAWPNTNLLYQVLAGELKETLAISSVPASESPSLTFYLQYAVNLWFNPALTVYANGQDYTTDQTFTTTGTINFIGPNGVTVCYLPAPYIYDSSKIGSKNLPNSVTGLYGATLNIGTQISELTVDIRIPVSFLKTAVYPIYFDPSLSTDGSKSAYSATSSLSASLTTSDTNDVIIVFVTTASSSLVTVNTNGVTATGLSFSKRVQQSDEMSSVYYDAEEWYAISSGTLNSKSIAVALSGSASDDSYEGVFGINGANTASPFDTNGLVPDVNYTTSGSPMCTISTSNANDIIIGAMTNNGQTPAAGSGFTEITGASNTNGDNSLLTEYKIVSATQSDVRVAWGSLASTEWIAVADAVVQASSTVSITFTSSTTSPATGWFTVNGSAESVPYTITSAVVGNHYELGYNSPANTVAGQTQYTFVSWTSTNIGTQTAQNYNYTVSTAETVTENVQLQYAVAITTSGIGGDTSTNTVATLQGTAKAQSTMPYSVWVNNGASCTYSFPSTVSGTASQDQYIWASTSGLSQTTQSSAGFTVSTYGTITGTFTKQYDIQITSSGISTDTSTNTVATLQGTSYYESQLPASVWVSSGSSCTYAFSSPVASTTTGKEYVWSSTSGLSQTTQSSAGFSVSTYGTITGTYGIDYYLTVTSSYGSPTGQGWYASGTSVSSTVTTPVAGSTGVQYVTSGWTGTGSLSSGGTQGSSTTGSFSITAPSSCTWNWITQYYLTVTSSYGSPSGAGWYNSGGSATFGVTSPSNVVTSQSQELFTTWTGSGSGSYSSTLTSTSVTMNNPITETAGWQLQYYLTVSSVHGTTSGTGWYNSGATAYAGVSAGTVAGSTGVQYVFASWSLGGTTYSQSSAVTMGSYVTDTASWITQYSITPSANSNSVINPSSIIWVNSGANQAFTYSPNSGYQLASVTVDGSPINLVTYPSGYTFNDVTTSHTIVVSSSLIIYTVTLATLTLKPMPGSTVTINVAVTLNGSPVTGYSVNITKDGILSPLFQMNLTSSSFTDTEPNQLNHIYGVSNLLVNNITEPFTCTSLTVNWFNPNAFNIPNPAPKPMPMSTPDKTIVQPLPKILNLPTNQVYADAAIIIVAVALIAVLAVAVEDRKAKKRKPYRVTYEKEKPGTVTWTK
jgi:hypothetical protein